MPISVFGNGSPSIHSGNKIDISLFVQKLYLRTSYVASNIEEDFDLKSHIRIIILPCPREIKIVVCKLYADK